MVFRKFRATALTTIAVAVIFFAYAWMLLPNQPLRWNSPDEAANAFFTKLFAEKGELSVFEPLNFIVGDRVHPRSVAVVNGYLVPGGFLGVILVYGTLARIIGVWVIPYLTPLFAAAAVLAFAALVRPVFGRSAAVLSGVLLALHPAYWYYSARGLFPNVPFLAFAVFGAYFLLRKPFASFESASLSRALDDILGALALSFAVWMRPSELFWLAPSAILLTLVFRRELTIARLVRIASVGILSALFLMILNQSLYGSPVATGYNASPDDHEIAFHSGLYPATGGDSNVWLPFGLHPRSIIKNAWDYGLRFFWWYTLPALAGFALALRDWKRGLLRREGKVMLALLGFAAAVLGVIYGSGVFTDTLNVSVLSLGDSHVRYFLPAYVLAVPFAALGILRVGARIKQNALRRASVTVSILGMAMASAWVVYWSGGEGLLAVSKTIRHYEQISARVQELVPPEGVIVTDRNDKVFFPERRVVVPLRDPGTFKALPILARRVPLFYYGITLADDEFTELNDGTFGNSGLMIASVESFGSETLYRITKK